ncbi:MAG: endonuclease III domain-containing protein [bacterium]|nr:endonuclease III domain-containing protein [bacterium]
MPAQAERLEILYQRLYEHFGPQGWWPGESAFEVVVGAILTQNTNWKNVEKAIFNLKEADLLSLPAMLALPQALLAEYIRPAGYYNIKAGRLRNLLTFIEEEHDAGLDTFFSLPQDELRRQLLAVKGIGPETADSIMLYAAAQPIFVVDTYTHRILLRHDLIDEDTDYHTLQELFMNSFPPDVDQYGEFHALLVRTGNQFCKKTNPRCDICPLNGL